MMIKGALVLALSLTAGTPVLAGDRPIRNEVVPARTAVRFSLPTDTRKLDERPIRSGISLSLTPRSARRFDLAGTYRAESLRLTEVTADEGGRYAVQEALSEQRKPRFRRSALGTMLVLKLDGEEESPTFSVGGGGVAEIVWQAAPKP